MFNSTNVNDQVIAPELTGFRDNISVTGGFETTEQEIEKIKIAFAMRRSAGY